MKNIYLDQNIIIDIENNRKPSLVKTIENIDREKYRIIFSPAHIEEIAAAKIRHNQDEKSVDSLLNLLDNLTKSKALLPFPRDDCSQEILIGVYLSDEHPKITFERVISQYNVNECIENNQKKIIIAGILNEMLYRITSKCINNMDMQEKITEYIPELCSIIMEKYAFFEKNHIDVDYPEFPITAEKIKFEYSGKYFTLHEMIVEKIIAYLDFMRYYPDKPNQHLQGVHDTSHAIYAAYCDFFVTNDKRLKNKANETYKWLGIKTKILDPEEFINYLIEQQKFDTEK